MKPKNTTNLLIPVLLLLVSCAKSPTTPETGSLSGTVKLEGQTDYSGITVALYELAELDTTILRYNRLFPNVGILISQVTEFDHRFGKVVAESQTSSDGTFTIENAPEGLYNFVARKEGFGWKYLYNVPINSGSTSQLPSDQMTLLGEAEVEGRITQNTIWQRDRHYIVTGDITVPLGSELTIEQGALIRFDGYWQLEVQGAFRAVGLQGNMITFTSNNETPQKENWSRLELRGADSTSTIERCKIEWGDFGIVCKGGSPRIANNLIRSMEDTGLLLSDGSTATVEGNRIFDTMSGVRCESNSNPLIQDNLLGNQFVTMDPTRGIYCIRSSPTIENNIVSKHRTGIWCEFNSDAIVENNLVERGKNGLFCYDHVDAVVRLNTFRQFTDAIFSCNYQCYPVINNNNAIIVAGTLAFYAKGSYGDNPGDIDVSSNWWGTDDSNVMLGTIIDDRYDTNENYSGNWEIVYQPNRKTFLVGALPY